VTTPDAIDSIAGAAIDSIARAAIGSIAVALSCLSLAACAPASHDDDATSSLGSEIIGGTESGPEHDAVVLLVRTDRVSSFSTCSAVLIAPNLVVTARHCVSPQAGGSYACDDKGALVTGSTGGRPTSEAPLDELYVFAGATSPVFSSPAALDAGFRAKKVFHDGATIYCNHDLALILLTTDVPNATLLPIRLDGKPAVGDIVTAVGFGIDESSTLVKTRRERSVAITRVGPYAGGADVNLDPSAPPNEFHVGEATCRGDSGGAVISKATGALLGIVSAGGHDVPPGSPPAAKCMRPETTNGYTKTAPFKTMIRAALAESGHEPWLENGRDPSLPPEPAPPSCSATKSGARTPPLSFGLLALVAAVLALRRRASRAATRRRR
jgi:hypothetical protein